MSSPTLTPEARPINHDKNRQAVLIIVACTFISTAAQFLIKTGANQLGQTGFIATLLGIFTIPSLFFGYCLYGIFTILMVYALREGELSILYPIIALSYVWVMIVSVIFLNEAMNFWKGLGVAVIVAGVGVLGMGGKR